MYGGLPPFWRIIIIIMTILGIILTLNQIFFWNIFGLTLFTNSFLYFVLAFFLPMVFLFYPASKRNSKSKIPWYDAGLFILTIVVTVYFGINGENIVNFGWDFQAPLMATIFSVIFWLIVIEALRRTAGLLLAVITLIFSLYPLFADKVPIYFLQGVSLDFLATARTHSMGVNSILGLPLQTAGTLLVGFLFFGVALQFTGGAAFFYNLAQSLFGKARGGSAKVAIVSSGFMGMMSGNAVSNVLTTGPMTIPAMKKAGFEPHYAAGIEATAASGGSITPPIMGTAAFLMVSFTGIPYSEIALAAAIPAFLYYFGIYMQIDAYSAKKGLIGLPKSELPQFLTVLKSGWPYILSLALLVFLLTKMKVESQAPFYVATLLIFISLFYKKDRTNFKKLLNIIFETGKTISEVLGIIAGVGLIVGGLSVSGVSLSLARELIAVVGENTFLILIAGAITCFILTMGMTVSAVYVFIAIVMAPALVDIGMEPIVAHLFIIYWAAVSDITPPVALAAITAAGLAKAPPMQTGLTAMKLGSVKYFIPFFFVYNPAIVAQGDFGTVVISFITATIGIFLIACGFEGWLVGVDVRLFWPERIIVTGIGTLLMFPSLITSLIGLAIIPIIVLYLKKRKTKVKFAILEPTIIMQKRE